MVIYKIITEYIWRWNKSFLIGKLRDKDEPRRKYQLFKNHLYLYLRLSDFKSKAAMFLHFCKVRGQFFDIDWIFLQLVVSWIESAASSNRMLMVAHLKFEVCGSCPPAVKGNPRKADQQQHKKLWEDLEKSLWAKEVTCSSTSLIFLSRILSRQAWFTDRQAQ